MFIIIVIGHKLIPYWVWEPTRGWITTK